MNLTSIRDTAESSKHAAYLKEFSSLDHDLTASFELKVHQGRQRTIPSADLGAPEQPCPTLGPHVDEHCTPGGGEWPPRPSSGLHQRPVRLCRGASLVERAEQYGAAADAVEVRKGYLGAISTVEGGHLEASAAVGHDFGADETHRLGGCVVLGFRWNRKTCLMPVLPKTLTDSHVKTNAPHYYGINNGNYF